MEDVMVTRILAATWAIAILSLVVQVDSWAEGDSESTAEGLSTAEEILWDALIEGLIHILETGVDVEELLADSPVRAYIGDPDDDVIDYIFVVPDDVPEARLVTVWTTGIVDTRAIFFDVLESGTIITVAEDDDSGEGSNFRVVRRLDPGKYHFSVMSAEPGNFAVHLSVESIEQSLSGLLGREFSPVAIDEDGR